MTTADLRKLIHVRDFSIDETGVEIIYLYNNNVRQLKYSPWQACDALCAAGIIDTWQRSTTSPLVVVDGKEMSWEQFADEHGMYQYAALLLAVNYELMNDNRRMERNKDMVNLARSVLFPSQFLSR